MYNLLIALGIGALAFAAGSLATNTIIAGVIPAMLASGIGYFLLMRRTGKQLAVITQEAMDIFQNKMPSARTPEAQQALFAEGRTALERGFSLQRWQFLIGSQLHAQLGSLSYMQMDFTTAHSHLLKADTWLGRYTAWQPLSMLALIELRNGDKDAAVKRLSGLTTAGSKDALFWALYAVSAHRAGQTEVALKAISEGLEKVPSSKELKTLADQIRNKRRLTPEIFGQGWLQFFPDQAQQILSANPALRQQMMAAQAANGSMDPGQMNRAQRRAAKRGKQPQQAPPLKHPRF
ncbi:MAG: hypothetical protein ACI8S6_002521 [Myxococcota bacterium]|jgi:hypothetical protein